jgi:hypothetical protein
MLARYSEVAEDTEEVHGEADAGDKGKAGEVLKLVYLGQDSHDLIQQLLQTALNKCERCPRDTSACLNKSVPSAQSTPR